MVFRYYFFELYELFLFIEVSVQFNKHRAFTLFHHKFSQFPQSWIKICHSHLGFFRYLLWNYMKDFNAPEVVFDSWMSLLFHFWLLHKLNRLSKHPWWVLNMLHKFFKFALQAWLQFFSIVVKFVVYRFYYELVSPLNLFLLRNTQYQILILRFNLIMKFFNLRNNNFFNLFQSISHLLSYKSDYNEAWEH